jgi:hypothetical protein
VGVGGTSVSRGCDARLFGLRYDEVLHRPASRVYIRVWGSRHLSPAQDGGDSAAGVAAGDAGKRATAPATPATPPPRQLTAPPGPRRSSASATSASPAGQAGQGPRSPSPARSSSSSHLLKDPAARFTDLGYDYHVRKVGKDKKLRSHLAQIQALGYDVTITPRSLDPKPLNRPDATPARVRCRLPG